QQLHIVNAPAYGAALVNVIYAGQEIAAGAPDKATAILLKSMATNPLPAQSIAGIYPGLIAQAMVRSGNVASISPTDPNFATKMYQATSCSGGNIYCQYWIAQDQLQGAQSRAQADAAQSISLGNNYKDTFVCQPNAPNIQQQFSQQYAAAAAQLNNRINL